MLPSKPEKSGFLSRLPVISKEESP